MQKNLSSASSPAPSSSSSCIAEMNELRSLLDSAIEFDQRIVLRTELLAQSPRSDKELGTQLLEIREDAMQNAKCLHKAQKILKALKTNVTAV